MWPNPNDEDRGGRLAEKVRRAKAVNRDLVSNIIAQACARLPLLNRSGKVATHIARLIESSAWTELSLALIALELPGWRLRRLVNDGGEWHCSLSRQPNLPVEIDDTADASHELLPLAILAAFLEAQRRNTLDEIEVRSTREVVPATAHVVCCDNFA